MVWKENSALSVKLKTPPEFLDKELQKIVNQAPEGRQYADKLVKVQLNDGKEIWLLIHVEVQGEPEAAFAQRMYTYYQRILSRYKKEVVSLAVLKKALCKVTKKRKLKYKPLRGACRKWCSTCCKPVCPIVR